MQLKKISSFMANPFGGAPFLSIPERPVVLFLLFLGCLIWQIAYFPGIIKTEVYDPVIYAGYFIFCVVFFMKGGFGLVSRLKRDLAFRLMLFCIFWQVSILMIFFAAAGELPELGTIIQVCSVGMLYAIGASLKYFEVEKFLFFLGGGVLISALYTCIFSGAASFDVELMNQSGYLVSTKNQQGGVWILSAALLGAVLVAKDKLKNYKTIVAGLLVLCVLFVRCRTAFLAGVVSMFLLFVVKYSKRHFWFWILGTGFASGLIVWLFKIGAPGTEFVSSAFFAGREVEDFGDSESLDKLSSGRIELMEEAIDGIRSHPVWGILGDHQPHYPTHNFFLRVWAQNGILGGLGIIVMYVAHSFLILGDLKRIRERVMTEHLIGVFAMIVPFFISLGEPTYPYGPSTATGIAFLFWGYSRARMREQEMVM